MKAKDIERISKALGDPNRIQILEEVKKYGYRQCADICGTINLAQPSVSHHLKQLVEADLLLSQKEGRNLKYVLNQEVLDEYIACLNELKG